MGQTKINIQKQISSLRINKLNKQINEKIYMIHVYIYGIFPYFGFCFLLYT